MTDKLREEAECLERIVGYSLANNTWFVKFYPFATRHEANKFCVSVPVDMKASIRNDALEEAASLMQDIVFVSDLPKDEAHNSMERAEAIRKLKVKP